MNKQQIVIRNEATVINATGKHNSGHCKSVIRLEDMKVFSSIIDAANDAGCHYSHMINHLLHPEKTKSVKGMHYAYLRDVLCNPDNVFTNARKISDRLTAETRRADANAERADANEEKARLWDEYQAELRAAEEAEAKRIEAEAKAKEKRAERKIKLEARVTRLNKKRAELYAQVDTIEKRLEKLYDELDELEDDED